VLLGSGKVLLPPEKESRTFLAPQDKWSGFSAPAFRQGQQFGWLQNNFRKVQQLQLGSGMPHFKDKGRRQFTNATGCR